MTNNKKNNNHGNCLIEFICDLIDPIFDLICYVIK